MIISHEHRYIFLKTTKTAGTSVEISLSRSCGEDDVITPISPKDEDIRRELGVFPQNHSRPLRPREYSAKDWVRALQGKRPQKKLFWNHIKAAQVKDTIGSEVWDDYFKFCFVRNPWDRAVSRYFWNIEKTGRHETMDESLSSNDPNSNFDIYTIDGQIAVDFVGKYENLVDDLAAACDQIGLPFDRWVPRAKGGSRREGRHYSDVLTERQAQFIRERCAAEIEWFGYEF